MNGGLIIINYQLLTLILPSVVSIISIAISYYLGLKAKDREYYKNNLSERYEKAYVPITRLLIEDLQNCPIFIRDRNTALKYSEIIINNINHYELETWKIYPAYYDSYMEFMGIVKINPDLQPQFPYINEYFINLILSILQEGSEISKELSKPDICSYLYNHIYRSCMPPKG